MYQYLQANPLDLHGGRLGYTDLNIMVSNIIAIAAMIYTNAMMLVTNYRVCATLIHAWLAINLDPQSVRAPSTVFREEVPALMFCFRILMGYVFFSAKVLQNLLWNCNTNYAISINIIVTITIYPQFVKQKLLLTRSRKSMTS